MTFEVIMNIGKLRNRIELQSSTTTTDSVGQQSHVWTTYTTVWATIHHLTGKETLNAQQLVAEITHRVTIRYNSSLNATHRIKYGTRYFYINFINNANERNEYQEIMCKEKI